MVIVAVAITKGGGRITSGLAMTRLVVSRGIRAPRCMAIAVGSRFIGDNAFRRAALGSNSIMRFLCFVKNNRW